MKPLLQFARLAFFFFAVFFMATESAISQEIEAYKLGLSQFQEGEFEEAEKAFFQALDGEPNNPLILYNWGLAKMKLGQNGWANAAWRKALSIDPTFSSAREALSYLFDKAPLPGRKSPQGYWEIFRSQVLTYLPNTFLAIASALLLCCSGWLIIQYSARRSSAIHEELPLPPIPWLGIGFFAGFLIFQTLFVSKLVDYFHPRGIVVAEAVELRTAPDATASGLFEIGEGAEVIIHRSANNWLQISYPSGLAGWAQKEEVFQISGKEL